MEKQVIEPLTMTKKSNANSISSSNGTGLLHLQGEEVEDDASLIYEEQANEAIRAVMDSEMTCLFDDCSGSHDLQKGPCTDSPLSVTPHI